MKAIKPHQSACLLDRHELALASCSTFAREKPHYGCEAIISEARSLTSALGLALLSDQGTTFQVQVYLVLTKSMH